MAGLGRDIKRVVVTGSTGSGKTSFARRLAAILDVPCVEMDALNWRPDWQEAPLEEFRAAVAAATSQDGWVIDGNYSKARDLVWPRAEVLVCLDYPFLTVFRQLLHRTLGRIVTQEVLWHGNRERFAAAFLSRDSLLLWLVRSHWRRKRQMPELLSRPEHAHLRVVRVRSPRDVESVLATFGPERDGG